MGIRFHNNLITPLKGSQPQLFYSYKSFHHLSLHNSACQQLSTPQRSDIDDKMGGRISRWTCISAHICVKLCAAKKGTRVGTRSRSITAQRRARCAADSCTLTCRAERPISFKPGEEYKEATAKKEKCGMMPVVAALTSG